MRKFQKCTKSHEELPNVHKIPSWDFVHYLKSFMRSYAFTEDARGILCIFGSFSWEFVHYWKFLMGFCAFLEVFCGILCLFGSSSWDFVHLWKILVGFCAYLEVPRVI
jgi:hypothetical protein